MYYVVVYLHILGAFVLLIAHGVSAAMAFGIRRDQDPARIRMLLGLSDASLPLMYVGLVTLLVAGIAAGFMGGWWGRGWIGTSLVLLIVLFLWMGFYARSRYGKLRTALGVTYRGIPGANPPASDAEILKLVQATNPGLLAGGSFLIIAIILYLMVFKPF